MLFNKLINIFRPSSHVANTPRKQLMKQLIAHMPLPENVLIEPSYICNFKCIMCERHYKELPYSGNGMMDMKLFRKIMPILGENTSVNLSGYGEAFLHPEYLEMLKLVSKKKVKDVHAYSNGSTLTEKIALGLVRNGLKRLFLSIHAASNETNIKITNTSLDKIMLNLKMLQDIKQIEKINTPAVTMQIVLMQNNIEELGDYIRMAGKYGVKYVTGVPMITQSDSMQDQNILLYPEQTLKIFEAAKDIAKKQSITLKLPQIFESLQPDSAFKINGNNSEKLNINKIENIAGKFIANNNESSTQFDAINNEHNQPIDANCEIGGIFNYMNVRYNGDVYACDWPEHFIGNLNNNTIDEIWNGELITEKRKIFYDKGISCLCPGCARWNKNRESFL
jgi:radical SAM protein with 4Fe4S-binding SPASM domain